MYRSLSHPNIVQFLGIFRGATDGFIVTEHMAYGPICNILKSQPNSVELYELYSMYVRFIMAS